MPYKAKKSDSQWCWANFRYEGVPTCCFICGLIGHNERYCEKLFDTPLDRIEKPYSAWIRAEPRRKNYTEGSKWLRQGNSFPATVREGEQSQQRDKSITRIPAGLEQPTITSGPKFGDNNSEIIMVDGVYQGDNSKDKVTTSPNFYAEDLTKRRDNNLKIFESSGLMILDPKRRRMEKPNIVDQEDKQGLEDEEMIVSQNQKNLIVAVSVVQARLVL